MNFLKQNTVVLVLSQFVSPGWFPRRADLREDALELGFPSKWVSAFAQGIIKTDAQVNHFETKLHAPSLIGFLAKFLAPSGKVSQM